MTMFKTKRKDQAEAIALRMALSHGFSVLDDSFYVGTKPELLAIGVVDIMSWKDLSEMMFHRREAARTQEP